MRRRLRNLRYRIPELKRTLRRLRPPLKVTDVMVIGGVLLVVYGTWVVHPDAWALVAGGLLLLIATTGKWVL